MKSRRLLQRIGFVLLALRGPCSAYCQEELQTKRGGPLPTAPSPEEEVADWGDRADEQVDEITLRNLKRIMWAVHVYADAKNGQLPPAAVTSRGLAPDKRLSGFVLLLPYLGIRPSYLPEDDEAWQKCKADNEAAKRLFAAIDLEKAWDDPANAQAARTVVPSFVAPGGAPLRDQNGFAVSHFAFVRGSAGQGSAGLENGAFPVTREETVLTFADIKDGTDSTLAVGQIHEQLGPWIAAGASTARHVLHPSVRHKRPKFGSQHAGAAYFANLDGFAYFFDMASVDPQTLWFLAGRSDRGDVRAARSHRYSSAMDWKKGKKEK